MSDGDTGGFAPIAAAIPSRATGEMKPIATTKAPAKRARKPSAVPKRPARKVAKKPTRKAKRVTVRRHRDGSARASATVPANPNRPLELKTRLNTVLAAIQDMSKPETSVFTGMMQHLEDLPRGQRKRIIGALAQVYR